MSDKVNYRVRLLRDIVSEAERSVQAIGDPGLRLAAFEKNLETLLAERYLHNNRTAKQKK